MKNQLIITIGRQYGSGGRRIGKLLSEQLGINFYDKKLLTIAAKESGFSEEIFEKADEKASSSLSYALPLGFPYFASFYPTADLLSNDGLFLHQSNAIRKIASEESCVIVGRCADYILRDNSNRISFFIHDLLERKVQRVVERNNCSVEEARELIRKNDKKRSAYYNYYTNKDWGAAESYDFSIDVSVLGIEGSVQLIRRIIELKQKK